MNKKRALVLSGGGNRGSFELGVLKYLINEKGYRYDTLIGVSVGALNASFLSQYDKKDQDKGVIELEKLWRSIEQKDIFNPWDNSYFKTAIYSLTGKKPSILDNAPLKKLIEKTSFRDFNKLDVKLLVGVTELYTSKFLVIDNHNLQIKDYIRASASIPIIFQPIEINGIQYVDGGIRNNTPLKSILETGEYEYVDVIILVPKDEDLKRDFHKLNNIYTIGYRTIEILAHKILHSEVNVVNTKAMFEDMQDVCEHSHTKLRIIAPDVNLLAANNFFTVLNFNKDLISDFIDMGYNDAKKQIK